MYVQRRLSHELTPEEREKNVSSSKLLSKSTGPFRVPNVRVDVIMPNQDGIRHPVSIDNVTLVRHKSTSDDNDVDRDAFASGTQTGIRWMLCSACCCAVVLLRASNTLSNGLDIHWTRVHGNQRLAYRRPRVTATTSA